MLLLCSRVWSIQQSHRLLLIAGLGRTMDRTAPSMDLGTPNNSALTQRRPCMPMPCLNSIPRRGPHALWGTLPARADGRPGLAPPVAVSATRNHLRLIF